MNLKFAAPVVATHPHRAGVTVSELNIRRFDDVVARKTVYVVTDELPWRLELWKDATYDAIGDWTTQNAVDRILELLNAELEGSSS